LKNTISFDSRQTLPSVVYIVLIKGFTMSTIYHTKKKNLGNENMDMSQNFLAGLNKILEKRYHSAGRNIFFLEDKSAEDWFFRYANENIKSTVYVVSSEIAYLDLKNGCMEQSMWTFSADENFLRMRIVSDLFIKIGGKKTGCGIGNIQYRIALLGGSCKCDNKDGNYFIEIAVPGKRSMAEIVRNC